jgi:2-methylcitrate synthase
MFKRKKLFTNLDFHSGPCYHQLGIPTKLFTPIFVIARTSGWCAHIFEQRTKKRLIRPISKYVGPLGKKYIKIEDRID